MIDNDWGASVFPFIPGHEVSGAVDPHVFFTSFAPHLPFAMAAKPFLRVDGYGCHLALSPMPSN